MIDFKSDYCNIENLEKVVIYLKDSSFIPDSIIVTKNTIILFKNEEKTNITHICLCRSSSIIPEMIIEQNKSCSYLFAIPGRFEITESSNRNMKVRLFNIIIINSYIY